jgi:hypothetical protein
MPGNRQRVSMGCVTGVVLVVVGAVNSNAPLIIFGVLSVPFGIGLSVALRRRRTPEREPVRRV